MFKPAIRLASLSNSLPVRSTEATFLLSFVRHLHNNDFFSSSWLDMLLAGSELNFYTVMELLYMHQLWYST